MRYIGNVAQRHSPRIATNQLALYCILPGIHTHLSYDASWKPLLDAANTRKEYGGGRYQLTRNMEASRNHVEPPKREEEKKLKSNTRSIADKCKGSRGKVLWNCKIQYWCMHEESSDSFMKKSR